MDKLKPCPFCGAVAQWNPAYDHAIECSECDTMAGSYTSDAGAIAAWNRRTDLPPTLEAAKALPEIAALVEAAKKNRLLTSTIMKALMQQGRAGLLLADELHKADDKIRNALTAIAQEKQG